MGGLWRHSSSVKVLTLWPGVLGGRRSAEGDGEGEHRSLDVVVTDLFTNITTLLTS